MSRRQGLGAGGGSSDAGSAAAAPRGGTDGPVCEAGEDEVAGLAEPLSGLVLRLGGGAKLDGSRREERGAETWPSFRRVVCDGLWSMRCIAGFQKVTYVFTATNQAFLKKDQHGGLEHMIGSTWYEPPGP